MNIPYKAKDGYKQPQLQISKDAEADTTPLGKYGKICLDFLREEHHDRYAELRMSGDLMPLMHEVNDEAHKQIKELTEKLLAKEKYDESDTMETLRKRNVCQAEAEQIVLNEYVYQSR